MHNNMVETAVGAIVIAIAAAFFIFMYTTGGLGSTKPGYTLSANFQSVNGIKVGTDVRLAGIKVGTVIGEELNRETFRAKLTLAVDPALRLPDDTTAKIASEGLLGGNFIALEPGGSETVLNDGDELSYTQDALDLFKLVSDFMFSGNKDKDEPQQ